MIAVSTACLRQLQLKNKTKPSLIWLDKNHNSLYSPGSNDCGQIKLKILNMTAYQEQRQIVRYWAKLFMGFVISSLKLEITQKSFTANTLKAISIKKDYQSKTHVKQFKVN